MVTQSHVTAKESMGVPEALLSGSVPDLQFDRFATDVDHPGTKLYPDGVVRVLLNWRKEERERDTQGEKVGNRGRERRRLRKGEER